MTKFTPGPWEIDDMGDHIDIITNSDHPHGPTWIAKGISGYDGDIENCKLIAAAPDLLEALKALSSEINLSKLNVRKDFSLMNAHAAALKAIRKAVD